MTAEQPVVWRVKDFADGWIYYEDKAHAEAEARHAGALIQPLYATAAPAPAGWQELCPFHCRCHEAADEIERLRAAAAIEST